jgi:hypothetical protein
VCPGISAGSLFRMVPSGEEPLGFAGIGILWFFPAFEPTDPPDPGVDCESTGRMSATVANMLIRLIVMIHLYWNEVVVIIGSLQCSRGGLTMC